jgi:hypothetical protein
LALLIGVVVGLRAMTAPAVVSWAAYLGRMHLEGTWLAFLGYAWTPYYNAELTSEGLQELGCSEIKPDDVQKMDSVDFIPALQRVGKAAAARDVDRTHFSFKVFRP